MKARMDPGLIARAGEEMSRLGVDGWLLYDLEARNRVAAELVGLPEGNMRRFFVLLTPDAEPVALAHRIELVHWGEWNGELRPYVSWQELETELGLLLADLGTVAMEVSGLDAVPYVDNVPAGVVELVRSRGVEVVSSAPLLSRTYAQWGERGLALHRKAAAVLAETAEAAFRRAAAATREDGGMTEHDLAAWILERVAEEGVDGDGVIVGAGPNSANPHYWPTEGECATLDRGDVLLIDLWGRVAGEPQAVFADQTWMGVLGEDGPEGFDAAWSAVREARDGAVGFIRERWDGAEGPTGAEVDAHVREILAGHGYEEAIFHRTGHAMDRVNHGFGPNLDSVETRDDRRLVRGIGFSVEPAVYLPDRWGIRSEINVHLGPDGPEVSPPSFQSEPWFDA